MNKEEKKEYNRKWNLENKEHRDEYLRQYRIKNKAKLNAYASEYNKQYRIKNKENQKKYLDERKEERKEKERIKNQLFPEKRKERNKRRREKIKKTPHLKIRHNLSSYISKAIKRNSGVKAIKTIELIGCSVIDLKKYLESLFLPGMSWDNYGKNGWEIDHITPCDSFDLTDVEQQKACFHYTNLQPLWMSDNRKKSNKI